MCRGMGREVVETFGGSFFKITQVGERSSRIWYIASGVKLLFQLRWGWPDVWEGAHRGQGQ